MALTKISSTVIQSGAVTAEKVATGVIAPSISNVQIANSSWSVLDDTAVSLDGGYILINGSNFTSGCSVLINNTPATSVTFANSSQLRVEVPSANAGTYVAYVVNPGGGTAIGINALTYSATPTWVTGSTLTEQQVDAEISIQLEATGATSYTLQDGSSLPANTTLASNGLFSGTVTGLESNTNYSFTVVANDDENQDSPRTFSVNIVTVTPDEYFKFTTLLIQSDSAANTLQNNTFIDSSNNGFTITPSGNTSQGAFSPFSPAGWSTYFDGTGDEIVSIGTTSSFNFLHQSNALFTIECWLYPTVLGGYIFDNTSGTSNQTGITGIINANGTIRVFISRSVGLEWPVDGTSTGALTLNTWNHLAITYDHSQASSNLKFYINGSAAGVTNKSAYAPSSSSASNAFRIGSVGGGSYYTGYMSNFRICNQIVYSSSFTPPTTNLTAITNTHLLVLQSNRFIDNSTNGYNISPSGNTKVSPFSPFAPSEAYNPSTHGGSVQFIDGSGDYLSISDNVNLRPGTDNFTIECWMYIPTDTGGTYFFVNKGFGQAGGWAGWLQNAEIRFRTYDASSNQIMLQATGVKYGHWNHIAVVRNSGTIYGFVNGVSGGSISNSVDLTNTSALTIGEAMVGNISGFRYVKGSAVYTTNFTPPTSPPTNIANTQLLINFTNAGMYDASARHVLDVVGNVSVRTNVKKYGTGSMYFDGSGDQIFIPRFDTELDFDAKDFTVECWVYPTSNAASDIISINSNSNQSSYAALRIVIEGNKFKYYTSTTGSTWNVSGGTGTFDVPLNQWSHVAVTRIGTALAIYIDGAERGSSSVSGALHKGSGGTRIGNVFYSAPAYYTGYIDDLRITKGVARYTSNFTPPDKAFSVQ